MNHNRDGVKSLGLGAIVKPNDFFDLIFDDFFDLIFDDFFDLIFDDFFADFITKIYTFYRKKQLYINTMNYLIRKNLTECVNIPKKLNQRSRLVVEFNLNLSCEIVYKYIVINTLG